MSSKPLAITDDLYAYVIAHGSTPDPETQALIDETAATMGDHARMQIARDTAALLTLLARLIGVRHAVEIGTFTGLSALAIARGLTDGGRVITCDRSEEFTDIARRHWDKTDVADRIELRLGPALTTLRQMPAEPHIDLAFIDADKTEYSSYWYELVPRMRPGGLIVVDNVLFYGQVLAPQHAFDKAIVAFNEMVLADERVDAVMLPIADGITLARRK
ncbi:MAG TPA: O-methyltransferase [Micromonosporaceae bacterium]|jgi:caffeoyl-CoA O-methyltransferase|nr:O-methyltransferase [Micromonosporaceae bacterium]